MKQNVETKHPKIMQMIESAKHIRILLVVLFLCTSLSPEMFVLCTGDCRAAGAEPVNVVYVVCMTETAHRCEGSDECETDFVHHHSRRAEAPLPRDLSHAQGRPDLSNLEDLPVSSLSLRIAGLCSDPASDGPVTGASADGLKKPSSLENLQSVILLI
jgi:hypothetical protein